MNKIYQWTLSYFRLHEVLLKKNAFPNKWKKWQQTNFQYSLFCQTCMKKEINSIHWEHIHHSLPEFVFYLSLHQLNCLINYNKGCLFLRQPVMGLLKSLILQLTIMDAYPFVLFSCWRSVPASRQTYITTSRTIHKGTYQFQEFCLSWISSVLPKLQSPFIGPLPLATSVASQSVKYVLNCQKASGSSHQIPHRCFCL